MIAVYKTPPEQSKRVLRQTSKKSCQTITTQKYSPSTASVIFSITYGELDVEQLPFYIINLEFNYNNVPCCSNSRPFTY